MEPGGNTSYMYRLLIALVRFGLLSKLRVTALTGKQKKKGLLHDECSADHRSLMHLSSVVSYDELSINLP